MNFGSKILLGALALSTSSFAIVGIGGHWSPNMGASVDAGSGKVYSQTITNGQEVSASYSRGKVDGLQGFGLKLWFDALPFIDIEATANLQAAQYNSDLTLKVPDNKGGFAIDKTVPIEYDLGFPGIPKASLGVGAGLIDISVLYPFLKLPPVINLVKVYIGGGVTYGFQTPVLDSAIVYNATKSVLDTAISQANKGQVANLDPTTVATSVGKALADQGYESSVGGHVVLGARAKLPIIPIAVYANGKYYMNAVKSPVKSGFALELGGGLAF